MRYRIHQVRKLCLMGIALCLSPALKAQKQIDIESCYQKAEQNFPLIKQYTLIEKSAAYSLENTNKSYLPQFNIAGQATHQSAVTQVPISLPGVNIPTISKDQYKAYGEINQAITDLFTIKDQKAYIKASSAVETQKVEVELYRLRERINNLYFGILLLDEQIRQVSLMKKDIETGLDKNAVAIANGIALKSSGDILKAELLNAEQKNIELKANRKAYLGMLSLLINESIDENTALQQPGNWQVNKEINRPELRLYQMQKEQLDVNNKLLLAKNLPRLGLFLQGGIGRPALNMLSNDAKTYYIGGLRLNWNLSGLYTYRKEKKLIDIQQDMLNVQQETFVFNTRLSMTQQSSELEKINALINSDREIIQLRQEIKNTSSEQLKYGTVSTNDFLSAINAEDRAKQNLLLHQTQLLMVQYAYRNLSGN